MQTFILVEDLFLLSGKDGSNDNEISNSSTEKYIVIEEDLVEYPDEKKLCLVLRFKNCTGNVINLTNKEPLVDAAELTKAQVTISIDPTYHKSRSRTVRQAIDMVVRWRTIGTGYYDFQI